MRFSSDAQRRAVFARMGNSGYPDDSVLFSKPKYVYDGDITNQFSKADDAQDIIDSLRREAEKDPKKKETLERDIGILQKYIDYYENEREFVPDPWIEEPYQAPSLGFLSDDEYARFYQEWKTAGSDEARDRIVRKYSQRDFSEKPIKLGSLVYLPATDE